MTTLALCPAADRPSLNRMLKSLHVFTDVREFELALRHTVCSRIIVILPVLSEPPGIDWLRRLRRRYVLQTLILVTRREAENVAHLTGLTVDRLLWYREYASVLPVALRQRPSGTVRGRLAEWLSEVDGLSPSMRNALLASLEVEAPFRGVPAWAAFLNVATSTLGRQFRAELGTHGLHAKAWLDGVWLTFWLEASPRARSYAALARLTGADKRTIERVVSEIVGVQCAPADLTAIGLAARLVDHVQAAVARRGAASERKRDPDR
jgi:hypothetical protein